MIDFKSKILIKSKNAVGTEIASELSGNICAITRRDFSSETLENNVPVLIDNTTGDMDEASESFILSGKTNARIFVLTSDAEPLISDKNGILFISDRLGTENICVLLRYFLNAGNARKQAEKITSKVLLNMGFQAHLKGYRYLIEIISAVTENPELIYSFTHKLYPMIAEKHNVTPLSVERSVRHSIELTYDSNYPKFKEFFGYPLPKPTNTEFISFCAEKIRMELF
ncbi:MAG: sporulation initiation factor Spo0A C-terminal domain-containing protein [Ruminococcus sp.]|nr:sporulation initiation factor Spo0A C-terminal domain-containing protein [Ruminococcus sp.]